MPPMPVSTAILETIVDAGYRVGVACLDDGRVRVQAVCPDDGQRWIATAETELLAAAELWRSMGFDTE